MNSQSQLLPKSFASLCLAIALLSPHLAVGKPALPNIILLMGDDHGWEETGYNGHPHLQTPVLDDMAAKGLRLDHFYAAHPSCSPTRGSVLTGRHPNRYGTFTPNHSIRPQEITIAQLLKKVGYTNGHFGKWHVGPVKASSPTNPGRLGFDEWLSHDNFFELNPTFSHNGGPPKQFQGESSAIVIEAATKFIATAQQNNQPFFVVIWFGSPHEPYSGLPDDLALYDDLPTKYHQRTVKLTSNETGQSTRRPLGEVLRERYAEITAMDRSIGELRSELKRRNLQQDTLLWYCGDNGTPSSGVLASPLRGQKGTLYEGGIRVPGIIEWPNRIHTPRTTSFSAVTSDILPTLCALARVPLPQRPLDGINLVPLLDGHIEARPQPIFFWSFNTSQLATRNPIPYLSLEDQTGTTPLVKLMNGKPTRTFRNFHHPPIVPSDFTGGRVILSGTYKLVLHDSGKGASTHELFELGQDRAEEKNLYSQLPSVRQRLETQLKDWQTSVLQSLSGNDY